MKYCIDYSINASDNQITIAGEWAIKNIIFISNETQQKLICAPFVKANIAVSTSGGNTVVTVLSGAGVTLGADDVLTFMIDDFKSSQDIINGVGTGVSAVSGKVDTVSGKVDTVGGKVDTVDGKVVTVGGKVDNVISNLGAMQTGDLTIRQVLAAIQTNALTTAQLTSLQSYIEGLINAVSGKIGTSTDDGTYSTLFGKIAAAKAVIDAIYAQLGTDANNNTVHAKLTELLRVVDLFAFGYSIEANNDGTETYTLNLDNSASVDGSTLNIA